MDRFAKIQSARDFVPWSVAAIRVAAGKVRETGWKVYGLVDPRTLRLMYIGQTKRPLEERLLTHVRKPVNAKMRRWLSDLAGAGLVPQIRRLADTTEGRWERDEMHWIAWARAIGTLLNTDPGGDYRGAGARVRPSRRRMAKRAREQIRQLCDSTVAPGE